MLEIDRTMEPNEDAAVLIGELEAMLAAEYPAEPRHGLSLKEIFQPHIRFSMTRLDRGLVGCAGVALFPEFAEVKRVYVRQMARGRGVAQALIGRIEAETRPAGLALLRLETGTEQHAAMRLYEKAGFRRFEAFHPYAATRPETIAGSAFYEKVLTIAEPPSAPAGRAA
ncbi:MAG: GNAT family N-acetyltransferase [Acetobacteraceae bacterium]